MTSLFQSDPLWWHIIIYEVKQHTRATDGAEAIKMNRVIDKKYTHSLIWLHRVYVGLCDQQYYA